jgi:ribose transport system permease protein
MKGLYQNIGVIFGLIGICIIAYAMSPKFASPTNLLNLLFQASVFATLAMGEALVIFTAGIDLSVASVMALSSTLGIGGIVWHDWNLYLGILVSLLTATGLGAINGIGIAKIGIHPLIMTLIMMAGARGGVMLYTGGADIIGVPDAILAITNEGIGPVRYAVIIVLSLYLIFHFFLSSTKKGRHIYAVGGNEEASYFSGINIGRTKLLAYSVSGFFAGIAGILITSKLYIVSPRAGYGDELTIIAAVVIGGVSLTGGTGNAFGVLLGVLILSVVDNMCDLRGVPPAYVDTIKALAIFVAASIDGIRRKGISFRKHKGLLRANFLR